MLHSRKAMGGAGLALGFTLLVAWMVPPTDPRPMAPNWRAKFQSTAPPAPVAFAGFAPYIGSMPAAPVEQSAYVGADGTAADVTVYRGSATDDYTSPASYVPAEPVHQVSQPVSGYGHRWTEDENPYVRDCRGAPNAEAAEHCFASVADRNSDGVTEDASDEVAFADADD